MMKSGKINYIELPAADLEAVKAFYSNALGWTFEDYGPEYAAFNDGEFDGGFFKADLSSSTANGAALIVLYAENLEALQDTLVKNGAKICREIFTFPGGRRFHFLDPNNNELAVWSDK
ncbi:VOC family protein [Pseudovibrio ascidiaceicola]|uniref:VOC family protein n=1 Tax=Pseudovibrio ascidiaceicola TaxID=285279 RepID=UPI000D696861|nr:VOC family protein [Pseudovibrio ascidiaceicola]